MNLHRSVLGLWSLTGPLLLLATHFLGGEVRYIPTGNDLYTYSSEVHIYTRADSPADRPEIPFEYGDGTVDTIPRVLIQDFPATGTCGNIQLSTYHATHTYPGPGSYFPHFVDQNRNGGIYNIPNSISQGICVGALLVIDPLLGTNHSLTFDSMQFVIRRNWNTLIHETTPMDADGDSMSFELVVPFQDFCQPIAGYTFPDGVNYTWLDPATGTYYWDYPPYFAEWTLAIRGSEYRNGQLIGQVTRDMSFCIAGFIAGIDENSNATNFSLFPTLVEIDVTVTNLGNQNVQLEFVSTTGALVGELSIAPGQQTFSLAEFASGIYTANFRDTEGRLLQTTRLVRQ